MKKFQFHFASLMLLRQAKFQQQELKFGAMMKDFHREEEKLQENLHQSDRAWKSLEKKTRNGGDSLPCSSYHYIERLKKERQSIDEDLNASRSKMNIEKKKYIEAKRQVCVLEKLEEKDLHSYRQKYMKQKDAEASEIYFVRSLGRSKGKV